MSTIWKVKIHKKVYDKSPGDHIQAMGLIKNPFFCSLLIAHSEGHLDRRILRPQRDLVAPRKKSLQLADQATHFINDFKSSSTRPTCLFREKTGFSRISYYYLGFRSKVSEVRRRSWQPRVRGKEEVATRAQEGRNQRFCGGLKGGKKRKWHNKIILQDTEWIQGRRTQALQSTEN